MGGGSGTFRETVLAMAGSRFRPCVSMHRGYLSSSIIAVTINNGHFIGYLQPTPSQRCRFDGVGKLRWLMQCTTHASQVKWVVLPVF